MKVSDWPLEDKNKFWHKFMGKCWHISDDEGFGYGEHCKLCGLDTWDETTKTFYMVESLRFDMSKQESFQIVKDFMEKEMPEVWRKHLDHEQKLVAYRFGGIDDLLNAWLSLDNLLAYLLQNTERWGWVECPECKGKKFIKGMLCNKCDGDKVVKSPALLFAEGLKEER